MIRAICILIDTSRIDPGPIEQEIDDVVRGYGGNVNGPELIKSDKEDTGSMKTRLRRAVRGKPPVVSKTSFL